VLLLLQQQQLPPLCCLACGALQKQHCCCCCWLVPPPPECVYEWLMCQPVNVLDVVVGLVGSLGLLLGLTGVDALQDAQPPGLVC
jgi:hypothetical protein